MKRSTARWTTALAAAALLGLPAAGWSQTPPSTPSPTTQKPPAAADQHAAHGAAQEQIKKAQTALKDVEAGTLPAAAKSKVAEIKRHLSSLEKAAGSSTPAKAQASGKAGWANDVAAIDKILTELLGPATTGAASEPAGATGTTGKAKASATLDDATKAKLGEVRAAVTAFAASMSGSPAPGGAEPASEPSPAATTAPPSAAAEAAAATPPSQAPPQTSTPSSTASPSQPAEAAQQPPATPQSGGQDEARRHLSAARDSLSQLTQLPAAAQLQGEPRNQVSQLIAGFNELITTKDNWRESYDKVNATLMALLGSETASPAPPAEPPATGTPGAVGTSGSTAMDPAIRGKLVEFKEHLMKFEKAAGAASASTPSASASTPSTPADAPSTAAPTASTPSSPSSASSPESASPAPSAQERPSAQQPPAQRSADSPMGHLDAIEAMLSTAGTSGLTLTTAQVEQLRTHLAEIRKVVQK